MFYTMDSHTPMILPKGFVKNHEDVYNKVAAMELLAPEQAWQFWHDYTVTSKALKDPTARRLENFWWHVVGSDRIHLSGRTLARIFKEISLGPTFVPLKGPPNRWEGNSMAAIPEKYIQQAMEILAREQQQGMTQPQSEAALNNENARNGLRNVGSSAAKPAPAHPILKKPRGPSTSGPRPTARFVSPDVSELDDGLAEDIPSSGSTVTPGIEMRQSIASPPKKKGGTRKFVASKAASKRRPVLPRKNSSQSSAHGEQSTAKIGNTSSSSSRSSGTPQRPISPQREAPVLQPHIKQNAAPGPSEKALGKRPALQRDESSHIPQKEKTLESSQPTTVQRAPEPKALGNGPGSGSGPQQDEHFSLGKLDNGATLEFTDPRRLRELVAEVKNTTLPRSMKTIPNYPPTSFSPASQSSQATRPQSLINLTAHTGSSTRALSPSMDVPSPQPSEAQSDAGSVPMGQSRSHSGYVNRKGSASSVGINRGLFTGATTSTSNMAAQGVIIDQGGSVSSVASTFYDNHGRDLSPSSGGSASSSVLNPYFTPTQPSTSASVPMARTKSHLALLLEREHEKDRDNETRTKKRGSRT
ncbi:uncharacterized protein J7T54_002214 [Emericellopsis cladophorae]|uniref:Nitrogen regulatory protein areA GATA-like domain-containing protein n=1 Tax=Emericellopsis cladophorae TaxID=2686198 RepID=A0A9Q0BF29_9HYPO|nr:uncharacterized protein J7T54_002214 [Emericellopsis cladophorae]KAI6783052.1 hypothetical protein J7T54_002214 [Emericellopsis cladophorae]